VNDALSRPRLTSIDWLRGLVMVLMLIDHTREYLLAETFWHNPTDLSVISSAAFLTRWITHICAPVFVLLAGVSVYLQIQAGKPVESVRRFLWTRGLWLVVCEFTLVTVGADFQLNPWAQTMVAQVIWVMGLSMILLSFMIRLPKPWILGIGLALVLGHNALDAYQTMPHGLVGLWAVLHKGGAITPFGGPFPRIIIAYPLLPWPGVMALGYCLGEVFGQPLEVRRRILAKLGVICLLGFVVLRTWNHYGEPSHWSSQGNLIRTLLSFVNITKYPPSLLFLLVTIGPGLLLLAWREGCKDSAPDRALITLGRVPMFFYLLQWPMAHGMGILFHALAGKNWFYLVQFKGEVPPHLGFKLWAVYLGWVVGLMLLYPLCHWFAGVKARRKDWWLSYL
jgi:uncharacterized membrane protein